MRLLLALALLAAAAPALAEESWVVRDAFGRTVETIERDRHGGFVRRDPRGRRIGTVERDAFGDFYRRDRSGRRLERIERDGFGGFHGRDRFDRFDRLPPRREGLGIFERGADGGSLLRDRFGRQLQPPPPFTAGRDAFPGHGGRRR